MSSLSKTHGTTGRVVSLLTKTAGCAATIFLAKRLFRPSVRPTSSVRDKVVLITGGSRGLGFALAQEMGAHGARLALCARDSGELKEACNRLAEKKIDASWFACDITKTSEIGPLLARIIEHFGTIDVLINNAGHIAVGPIDNFTHSDFERAMDVMFWAPVNLTFAVLPHMRKQASGHIVNIASIGGRVSVPHLLPYSCAKFALVGFSTGLSTEVKSDGIHVLTVVPGLMRTGSYLNAEFTGAATEEFAWFALLGNLPGFSVAAEYAASRIRSALENQQHTCTISLPAKLLIASEALLPEMTRTALAAVNRIILPRAQRGSDCASGKLLNARFGSLFQSLTRLGKSAALKFNE